MICRDCITNFGSYDMACLSCYARWILRFPKEQRLAKIEANGRHDIDELKQEMIRKSR